ncbi:MAG: hypothetical protein AB4911_10965 [Oscillochloridaceae bacterium umkhey_bin13]
MSHTPTPRRTAAPGLKTVISTAAVVVTLAGWAGLAADQTGSDPAALEASSWNSSLPAIPTVAPLIVPAAPVQVQAAPGQVAPLPARPVPVVVTRSSR